jgi:hypothetical protein
MLPQVENYIRQGRKDLQKIPEGISRKAMNRPATKEFFL